MRKPLTVYKASAGSGKTFTLAVQYIKLVVKNPQAYRNILAVTFTNKATEEMKMRILSQLYGIWKMKEHPEDYTDSKPYMEAVCQSLDNASPDWVSERAGIALSNLLHNYNYFRVMTIDTFFQSVLRNLARELDLTTNLRVGLNDAQVEEQAVDLMIDDLKSTDAVLQWLLRYIMENISDDKSWNVINQIKQFGKTIFRDFYKKESKELNQTLSEKDFFDHYTKTLRQIRSDALEQVKRLGQEFFDILSEEGFAPSDLSGKERGISSFFNKLREGTFDESIVNQTAINHLGNPEKWYTKTHPRREEIHLLAEGRLGNLLRRAMEERPRLWYRYMSADLTLRHLNQLRLLSNIEQRVHELNEENNRFMLSDTQQLLHSLIQDSDSPFIFEKTGSQLEHIMIDEFQDTSTVQWQNFRVLLQETMSHRDTENLIVGDVKQSIYRWRSGDWRLLNDIHREFPDSMIRIDTEKLRFNRRSTRTVIEFNNAFFTEAKRQECALLSDDPEASQLERAYADVCQQIVKDDEGYVNISLLPNDDYQEHTLARIVSIIDDLHQQHQPLNRIAILVRANRLIPLIANYFMEHLPEVPIVSDEAFRLDASPAVNVIIQALHLLTHPDDALARAFIMKTLPNGIPEAFDSNREQLRLLPLYELTEHLFALFRLNCFDNQAAYICAFFDHLTEYISDRPADIDDFISHWEENLASKTIQGAGIEGVRLISIHKSKGLEFDNVIIPFCDWQLEKSSGNIIWCSPQEEPFSQLPIVPVDYSRKAMLGTVYEEDYRHEHLQNVVDNLNLLYVAFTRARRQLYVIGHRDAKNSRSTIIQSVLPQIVGNEQSPLPQATLTGLEDNTAPLEFEMGLSPNAPNNPNSPNNPNAPNNPISSSPQKEKNVFLQPSKQLHVNLESFTRPASFRQSNLSRQFVEGADDDNTPQQPSYIQLGSLLHNVFSTIRTTADIDAALNRLETEGLLSPGSQGQTTPQIRASLVNMIRRRLEHPKVADWFSPRWTLYNECTILTRVDGKTIEKRPDRVMTDGHEWIVVDFKFGKPIEEHQDQVREYMDLLRQMGHEQVKGFLWYVYTNRITEV